MAFYEAIPWHEGEEKIHKLTKSPRNDNPTHPTLSQMLARRVELSPTIALGTIDDNGQIWCTLWGGDLPIAQQVARGGVIGIRTQVDASHDPVVQALYGGSTDGEVVRHDPQKGKMVSGLSILLEDRDRVKLFGRMLAGSLSVDDSVEPTEEESTTDKANGPAKPGNAQLVLQITQSLGNCPKYLNKKTIKSHSSAKPRLISDSPLLSDEAVAHVHSADIFFVASAGPEDMDCNHRGGLAGFVRVQQPQSPSDPQSSVLVWPEYSGNNLYQTLGNLTTDPRAGIVIPNMQTGTVLYLSGTAEILIDKAANEVISKTRLAVRFTVTAARFVKDGLYFRGTPSSDNSDRSSSRPITNRDITDGMSPYNPRVRYLTSELTTPSSSFSGLPPDEYRSTVADATQTATLIKKNKLTPTITKYRFRLSHPVSAAENTSEVAPLWTPGQYVALDFSNELYMGYSHMRDDDPTALNDDFIRTFTVASAWVPPESGGEVEFELVVRNVGSVTKWLNWQNANGMTNLEVRGFGGNFRFKFEDPEAGDRDAAAKRVDKVNAFIAAGIGITPLLGQLGDESVSDGRLVVLWTVGVKDIGLVKDVLSGLSEKVKSRMRVFVTGTSAMGEGKEMTMVEEVEKSVRLERRRMSKKDLDNVKGDSEVEVSNWYLCTAPAMRTQVQELLDGKTVEFENFDY